LPAVISVRKTTFSAAPHDSPSESIIDKNQNWRVSEDDTERNFKIYFHRK